MKKLKIILIIYSILCIPIYYSILSVPLGPDMGRTMAGRAFIVLTWAYPAIIVNIVLAVSIVRSAYRNKIIDKYHLIPIIAISAYFPILFLGGIAIEFIQFILGVKQ